MSSIKARVLWVAALILAVAGIVLLTIGHFNPEIYLIRDCSNLCLILANVCLFIYFYLNKSMEKVNVKKLALGLAAAAVLMLAFTVIMVVNILQIGL